MTTENPSTRQRIDGARDLVTTTRERAQHSILWQVWERMLEIEFVDRSVALAGKAFVSFFPLVIVVAAFMPPHLRTSIFSTLTHRLGMHGSSLTSAKQAFASAKDVRRATSVLGLVLTFFFASSFTSAVQRVYLRAWRRAPAGKVSGYTRGPIWLAVLILFMAALGGLRALLGRGRAWACSRSISLLASAALWWFTAWFLLLGEVRWRVLLPSGIITGIAMSGYAASATIWMPDVVASNQTQFGFFGVALALVTWFSGAAICILVGALRRAGVRRGRRLPRQAHPRRRPPAPGGRRGPFPPGSQPPAHAPRRLPVRPGGVRRAATRDGRARDHRRQGRAHGLHHPPDPHRPHPAAAPDAERPELRRPCEPARLRHRRGLGLTGAPIEGPTHFSQFDPLAFTCWGREWFETGCISAHFKTMVIEGEEVTASLDTEGGPAGRIGAVKGDGSVVLVGHRVDRADGGHRARGPAGRPRRPWRAVHRRPAHRGPAVDGAITVSVDMDTSNGELYPFSLRQKLEGITEPSDWYASADNPWGRPILPFEMISVLAWKSASDFPVRGPAIGLFLDLEVRLEGGPLFVGQDYRLEREVIGLGQSRRTESHWVRTTLTDTDTGALAATVVLHSGVFKESYAGYPADRL